VYLHAAADGLHCQIADHTLDRHYILTVSQHRVTVLLHCFHKHTTHWKYSQDKKSYHNCSCQYFDWNWYIITNIKLQLTSSTTKLSNAIKSEDSEALDSGTIQLGSQGVMKYKCSEAVSENC